MSRTERYCDLPACPRRHEEALLLAKDGMHALLDRTEGSGLIVNTENHHGISAEPQWMARFMREMNHPRLGLTVDTDNTRIDDDNPYASVDPTVPPRYIDRGHALETLLPFTIRISAKTFTFDNAGYEIAHDYARRAVSPPPPARPAGCRCQLRDRRALGAPQQIEDYRVLGLRLCGQTGLLRRRDRRGSHHPRPCRSRRSGLRNLEAPRFSDRTNAWRAGEAQSYLAASPS